MIGPGIKQVDLQKKIAQIVRDRLNVPHYRIFVFGSRAQGRADERSDIDIGIQSQSPIPAGVLGDIRAELDELPVLQKIDLVDFSGVSEEFKRVAMQTMEILYEQ